MHLVFCRTLGTGVNPNDGNVGPSSNAAESGINAVSYNGYNSNYNQQQQQQYYPYNSASNAWQRPNSNNYYNSPSNRYPPGSQGWYATGGNYWYNTGESLKPHAWFMIITIFAISVIGI